MKAIFILCLIAFSQAVSFKNSGYSALQRASFGSVLAQVKAMIKAGGPYDNVFDLLDDLQTQIELEEAEHKEMLGRNDDACEEEKAFRDAEITEGQVALKAATNQHATCEHSLGKAEMDLEKTQNSLADDRVTLTEATLIRETAAALFTKRTEDHRLAGRAIDGALNILDELVAEDATFLQLSQHSQVLLKTGVKIHMTSAYVPIIAIFAQMASSGKAMISQAS